MAEIARDQREQIARLLVRIAPDRPVAPGGVGVARAFEIAVGEQNRGLGAIRLQPHAIGREDVRPVEEIGDAAEALGLALGAIGRAGTVEAHQLGVGRRIEPGLDLEPERAPGRVRQHELRRASLQRRPDRGARRRFRPRPGRVRRRRARARRHCRPAGLGRSESVETTRVAWGSSEMSSSTMSMRKSGTR